MCGSSTRTSTSNMALKGENILEWTDYVEFAFIHIMLEKFKRTHTTSWKQRDWVEMNVEMERQFPDVQLGFQKLQQKTTRPKTMYKQFTELLHHKPVGWDEDTNTIKASPDI
ncbi:hypothetical protein CDL15_Pgr016740 [Punica granatum]|uniref:Myb/SANT-like domain-containing protein n=1 Tax=Punica granatum TaxID=22663 RepID=A0A218WXG3_PUNGR|nr:hypothetical protein CDL15_Pgr016740 [Punica granatum]